MAHQKLLPLHTGGAMVSQIMGEQGIDGAQGCLLTCLWPTFAADNRRVDHGWPNKGSRLTS